MNMHTAIDGLDAEIQAVRSELAAHIEGTLVPLMVRRALARLALGHDAPVPVAPPVTAAPLAPAAVVERPPVSYVPQGTPARILDLLRAAPGGTLTSREINAALSDVIPDTAAKAKTRLYKDGFVTRKANRYTIASRHAHTPPSAPKPQVTQLSIVLRILRSGPAEGMGVEAVDAAAGRNGLSPTQARAARYNLMARNLVAHDTDKRTWRLV